MEVTSATSTSYEEAVANSAPVDEVIFPKLFTPFVQKVPFSSAPLGSGFMIVDLKADGGCVIQAVYKKLATTGSSSQDPMFIVDSKKLSEDKANRDALLALTNFNRSFVESYAAKAVNSDTLLPALAQLSNKNFYLKVFPQLFDNPHKKDHPVLLTLQGKFGLLQSRLLQS